MSHSITIRSAENGYIAKYEIDISENQTMTEYVAFEDNSDEDNAMQKMLKYNTLLMR